MTPEAPSNQPKAGIPSLEQTTKTLPLSATSHSLPPPSALSLLRHPASHHQRLNLPAHLPPLLLQLPNHPPLTSPLAVCHHHLHPPPPPQAVVAEAEEEVAEETPLIQAPPANLH